MNFWLLFATLSIATFSTAVRQQAVAVKGKLLCGSSPARNTRVKLWDEDTGNFIFDLNLFIYILYFTY